MLSTLDWIVLIGTMAAIVSYGVYKTRGEQSVKGYLLGGNDGKWWTIGLSVMATQASAITFLSTPGQAYSDGMGFIQIYFGLPLALIVVCVFFIPIYYKLKVYTAYEYLESRFDVKTRTLAALYFLIQRGMGAGITIFAPAIILSSILGWNLNYTILVIGILVILYTVSGGTKAVNQTQKLQMIVIMVGMAIAFTLLLGYLPDEMSLREALHVAGASGKMEILDFSVDVNNRYTIWSGILGGFFLSLAYFGTDQSQVQRYLGGQSVIQSRLGLLFNALLKIPMQFFILLTGVLVFVFYQYNKAPIFFNTPEYEEVYETNSVKLDSLQETYDIWFDQKQDLNTAYLEAIRSHDEAITSNLAEQILIADAEEKQIRNNVKDVIAQARPDAETNDKDYVFISFILNHMPIGIIGLLLAVIFSAAMSSTAAELNALGSTTTVDIYRRSLFQNRSEKHYLLASKGLTMLWGIIAILFALVGSLFENLIQFVNIIGSLFYGTMLGFFIVAFAIKYVKSGTAVFVGALIAEAIVLAVYFMGDIGYLWYNLIGSVGVVLFSVIIQGLMSSRRD
jgi:solute:Na+ symporter, SSS family